MTDDPAMAAGRPPAGPFAPRLRSSPGFADWLEETGGSLAFSTYQAGRVFLVSARSGHLHVQQRRIGPAMGLAADADRLWIASRDQLWRFANTGPRRIGEIDHDAVYAPRWGIVTGPCDTHEIAGHVSHRGQIHELLFVNTRFSCLAAIDGHYNFTPVWKPPFVSGLAPEDRCHLNGLGIRDGEAAYVTACSETDTGQGWRAARIGGGVVIDVRTDAIVARGLTMPHSPRWHDGRIWLCDSGNCAFGWIDPAVGIFNPVAHCPGFARGLVLIEGRWAVIGLSRERPGKAGRSLPMSGMLAARQAAVHCGLLVVDLRSGIVFNELLIDEGVEELFDVAFVANIQRPLFVGFSEPVLQGELFNLPLLTDMPLSPLTIGRDDRSLSE